ncbi:MAG: glycosyltransferase family 2 protein [Candidatus Aenigmarchaeota archaeon]|nr:glycosyltransferase family 2 protein [Candidatus Aenigmarchaeota archaeon]
MVSKRIEVSVIIPTKNEEKTISEVIKKVKNIFKKNNIRGEIIVSDSSTDNTPKLAEKLDAKVITPKRIGYGAAYMEGFKEAKGDYIFMADADGTYDVSQLPKFIEPLKEGRAEMVMGSRFKGKILKGAMPALHQYIGNPFLTAVLNLFFGTKISDAHCGMRSIKKTALDKLTLSATGMDFASEMIIKAAREKLKIFEIPIIYYPRKDDNSTLNSYSDGWKHLRLLLLYSPLYLFLVPGSFLFIVGSILLTCILPGPLVIGSFVLDYHWMILGALFTIIGFQIITMGVWAKTYAYFNKIEKETKTLSVFLNKLNLERGIVIGSLIGLLGFAINLSIVYNYLYSDFVISYRPALFALVLIFLGIQIIFSSFFVSIIRVYKN